VPWKYFQTSMSENPCYARLARFSQSFVWV